MVDFLLRRHRIGRASRLGIFRGRAEAFAIVFDLERGIYCSNVAVWFEALDRGRIWAETRVGSST